MPKGRKHARRTVANQPLRKRVRLPPEMIEQCILAAGPNGENGFFFWDSPRFLGRHNRAVADRHGRHCIGRTHPGPSRSRRTACGKTPVFATSWDADADPLATLSTVRPYGLLEVRPKPPRPTDARRGQEAGHKLLLRRRNGEEGQYVTAALREADQRVYAPEKGLGEPDQRPRESHLPQAKGVKIICHVCNDIGAGARARPCGSSRAGRSGGRVPGWHARGRVSLGAVKVVRSSRRLGRQNAVNTHQAPGAVRAPAIRYEAVRGCLKKVAAKALEPRRPRPLRAKAGPAGGDWVKAGEPLIEESVFFFGRGVAGHGVYGTTSSIGQHLTPPTA